jgi:hypothetical protein
MHPQAKAAVSKFNLVDDIGTPRLQTDEIVLNLLQRSRGALARAEYVSENTSDGIGSQRTADQH